jgi:SAM-dependent methyltransferase
MTYGDVHGESDHALGSPAFFAEVDATFLEWNRPLHGARPFERIFPYDRHRGSRVLEVGCGMGTMASLWAREGAQVTAVDLNPTAVAQTRRRFELLGLEGDVREADGRTLPFADASFDYAWSWGVLHHSPDLAVSLRELLRVLRPGGGFGLMLYHRRSLLHGYMTRYVEGFLHDERRFLSELELASRYGDAAREEGNPHTWPVTRGELRTMLNAAGAGEVDIRVLGTDLDSVLRLMLPGLGDLLPVALKKPWARRLGWSLWASGQRR